MDERQRRKELAWRREVLLNPDSPAWQFKPYAEWSSQYERKKEKKEPPKEKDGGSLGAAAKRAIKEKARTTLLRKVRYTMISKIMKIILEVVSRMCRPVETKVREASDDLGALLNAMNGVVLTYRFGLAGRYKFVYLRKVAAAHLAETALVVFRGVAGEGGVDVDANLLLLERMISKEVVARKEDAKALLEAHLLALAAPAAKVGAAVAKVVGGAVGASVSAIAGAQIGEAAGEAATAAATTVAESDEVAEGTARGIAVAQCFIRMFVIERMDQLVEEVPARIAAVLDRVRAVYAEMAARHRQAEEAAHAATPAEARHAVMLAEVETVYAELEGKVSQYVNMLVDMMDAFSAPGADEADEEEEEDEADSDGWDARERTDSCFLDY